MALDKQLRALCEEHALTYLAVGIHRSHDGGYFYTANAHEDNLAASNGYEPDETATPAVAIKNAIENLNAKRTKAPVVSDLEAA